MDDTSARSIFYPGTISERKRYIALRFAAPVVTFIWLLIPLVQPSCGSNAESLYTFLFLYFLIYLIFALCVAWSIFDVVVGFVHSITSFSSLEGVPKDSKKVVLGVSFVALFLPLFVLLLISWKDLDDHKWYFLSSLRIHVFRSYVLPVVVFIGAIPLLIYFFWVARKKTRESFYSVAEEMKEDGIGTFRFRFLSYFKTPLKLRLIT